MNSGSTPNHASRSYMKNHDIIGKITIMNVVHLIITITNVVVVMRHPGIVNTGNQLTSVSIIIGHSNAYD